MNNDKDWILKTVIDCDGAEIHRDDWSFAEELEKEGKITLDAPHGPGRNWRRAELKKG